MGVLAAATAAPAMASPAEPAGTPAVGTATPGSVTPGGHVTFAISCINTTATSATLFGSSLGLPHRVPMDKGSLSGDFTITVSIPASTAPGTHHAHMDCSDGSSASAALRVTAFPTGGGAATGDGTTATQTNNGMATGGMVLIGVGAVLGGFAMRRRSAKRP